MEKKSIEYVLPEEIEKRSFEIIAAELAERGITLPAEQDPVTRRVIHTSADFDYAETMTYSENAVEIATNSMSVSAVSSCNSSRPGRNPVSSGRYTYFIWLPAASATYSYP